MIEHQRLVEITGAGDGSSAGADKPFHPHRFKCGIEDTVTGLLTSAAALAIPCRPHLLYCARSAGTLQDRSEHSVSYDCMFEPDSSPSAEVSPLINSEATLRPLLTK